MKIYSITNSIYKNKINKQNIDNNQTYFTNGLNQNKIEKTIQDKSLSFKGLSSFSQKFNPFEHDILTYYRTKQIINIDEIKQILKKYAPDMNIKNLNEAGTNANIHDRTCGYFKDEILFSQNGICINGEKSLFINPPNTNSFEDRIKFLQALVHEVTHAFQESSSDRISKFSWINNFNQIPQDFTEKKQIMSLFPNFFYHSRI